MVTVVIALVVTVIFALLIWRVRMPRIPSGRPALVPPSATAVLLGSSGPMMPPAAAESTLHHAPPVPVALSHPMPQNTGVLATELAHLAGARLSNLATPLVGLTEMALSSLDLDHPSRPDIEEIGRCGLQVSLIAQMLEVFGGVRHLRIESLPIETIWKAAEDELRLLLRATTVLHVDRAETRTLVQVDLELTRMMLLLLARNAEDAMGPGGTITVRLDRDTIHIRDTGPGIPDSVRAALYKPLNSGRDAEDGIGLGLHVTRLAALTQSSELRLERTGPEGTVFSLRFPRTGSAEAATP